MTWQVLFKVAGVASVEVEAETQSEAEAVAQELIDAQDDEVDLELKYEVFDAIGGEPEDGEDALDEAERDEG